MERRPLPSDEAGRRKAVDEPLVVDPPAEERFDRIARLACRLFDVPIALVPIVDRDRRSFKSARGLAASEPPREISFCGHAILGEEPFAVEDARAAPRFADNPLVTGEPSIRFYAGAPIAAPSDLRAVRPVGRYWGEEFLVVLTEADEAIGAAVASRISTAVATARLDGGAPSLCVTASLGVASRSASGSVALETLLVAADAALDRAKQEGKTRFALARVDEPRPPARRRL